MRLGSALFWAPVIAALAGCGKPAPPDAPDAPAAPLASPETAALCEAYDRIIAARSDTPAFASLPAEFELKPGMPCALAELEIAPARTGLSVPVPVRGYGCRYLDEPGAPEASGWPAWTGALEDVAACFGGDWEIAAVTDSRAEGPTRRVLMSSQPDVPVMTVADGSVDPVRFEWSQENGQGILFFVAAP